MNILTKTMIAASVVALPSMLAAEAIKLTPASPQPAAASLAPGLAVSYAFRNNGRTLTEAKSALKKSEVGAALAGFSYDTAEGEKVLTADKSDKVAAAISGYIKFEDAGTYVLDFLTNDGLEIAIGGQQVGLYDGVHACGYAGEQEVEVPAAGYYALEATYFQRKGSACLLMEWGPDSDGLEAVPDSAFYHAK